MRDNYEDFILRDMQDGPIHWCSKCERYLEDCICETAEGVADHAEGIANEKTENKDLPLAVCCRNLANG